MKHIWAPWRIDYVARPQPEGCVLCSKAHAEDDVAEQVLYRSAYNYVVVNAFPYNSGHLMVVPLEHVSDLAGLAPEVLADMMSVAQGCLRALNRCLRPHGVNIGMNVGKAAGAGIESHLHLHIVPRWEGDTNFMTSCADTRVVPQAMEATACQLRPLIAEELGDRG